MPDTPGPTGRPDPLEDRYRKALSYLTDEARSRLPSLADFRAYELATGPAKRLMEFGWSPEAFKDVGRLVSALNTADPASSTQVIVAIREAGLRNSLKPNVAEILRAAEQAPPESPQGQKLAQAVEAMKTRAAAGPAIPIDLAAVGRIADVPGLGDIVARVQEPGGNLTSEQALSHLRTLKWTSIETIYGSEPESGEPGGYRYVIKPDNDPEPAKTRQALEVLGLSDDPALRIGKDEAAPTKFADRLGLQRSTESTYAFNIDPLQTYEAKLERAKGLRIALDWAKHHTDNLVSFTSDPAPGTKPPAELAGLFDWLKAHDQKDGRNSNRKFGELPGDPTGTKLTGQVAADAAANIGKYEQLVYALERMEARIHADPNAPADLAPRPSVQLRNALAQAGYELPTTIDPKTFPPALVQALDNFDRHYNPSVDEKTFTTAGRTTPLHPIPEVYGEMGGAAGVRVQVNRDVYQKALVDAVAKFNPQDAQKIAASLHLDATVEGKAARFGLPATMFGPHGSLAPDTQRFLINAQNSFDEWVSSDKYRALFPEEDTPLKKAFGLNRNPGRLNAVFDQWAAAGQAESVRQGRAFAQHAGISPLDTEEVAGRKIVEMMKKGNNPEERTVGNPEKFADIQRAAGRLGIAVGPRDDAIQLILDSAQKNGAITAAKTPDGQPAIKLTLNERAFELLQSRFTLTDAPIEVASARRTGGGYEVVLAAPEANKLAYLMPEGAMKSLLGEAYSPGRPNVVAATLGLHELTKEGPTKSQPIKPGNRIYLGPTTQAQETYVEVTKLEGGKISYRVVDRSPTVPAGQVTTFENIDLASLPGGKLVLGRDGAAITNNMVSRQHIELCVGPDGLVCSRLNSLNTVVVDTMQPAPPARAGAVTPGDLFTRLPEDPNRGGVNVYRLSSELTKKGFVTQPDGTMLSPDGKAYSISPNGLAEVKPGIELISAIPEARLPVPDNKPPVVEVAPTAQPAEIKPTELKVAEMGPLPAETLGNDQRPQNTTGTGQKKPAASDGKGFGALGGLAGGIISAKDTAVALSKGDIKEAATHATLGGGATIATASHFLANLKDKASVLLKPIAKAAEVVMHKANPAFVAMETDAAINAANKGDYYTAAKSGVMANFMLSGAQTKVAEYTTEYVSATVGGMLQTAAKGGLGFGLGVMTLQATDAASVLANIKTITENAEQTQKLDMRARQQGKPGLVPAYGNGNPINGLMPLMAPRGQEYNALNTLLVSAGIPADVLPGVPPEQKKESPAKGSVPPAELAKVVDTAEQKALALIEAKKAELKELGLKHEDIDKIMQSPIDKQITEGSWIEQAKRSILNGDLTGTETQAKYNAAVDAIKGAQAQLELARNARTDLNAYAVRFERNKNMMEQGDPSQAAFIRDLNQIPGLPTEQQRTELEGVMKSHFTAQSIQFEKHLDEQGKAGKPRIEAAMMWLRDNEQKMTALGYPSGAVKGAFLNTDMLVEPFKVERAIAGDVRRLPPDANGKEWVQVDPSKSPHFNAEFFSHVVGKDAIRKEGNNYLVDYEAVKSLLKNDPARLKAFEAATVPGEQVTTKTEVGLQQVNEVGERRFVQMHILGKDSTLSPEKKLDLFIDLAGHNQPSKINPNKLDDFKAQMEKTVSVGGGQFQRDEALKERWRPVLHEWANTLTKAQAPEEYEKLRTKLLQAQKNLPDALARELAEQVKDADKAILKGNATGYTHKHTSDAGYGVTHVVLSPDKDAKFGGKESSLKDKEIVLHVKDGKVFSIELRNNDGRTAGTYAAADFTFDLNDPKSRLAAVAEIGKKAPELTGDKSPDMGKAATGVTPEQKTPKTETALLSPAIGQALDLLLAALPVGPRRFPVAEVPDPTAPGRGGGDGRGRA